MRKTNLLMALLAASLLASAGCGDDNDNGFFTPGAPIPQIVRFQLLTSGNVVINYTFWSSDNVGFAEEDQANGNCTAPDPATPQTANDTADQDGCSNVVGTANIFCEPGSQLTIHVDDGNGNTDSASVNCDPFGNLSLFGTPVFFNNI